PTIKFQRCTATGELNGSATSVVSPGLMNGTASVGMDGTGNFVVVWDGDGHSVYVQRFSSSGKKTGTQITVVADSDPNILVTWQSAVAMNSSGRFAVVWHERQQLTGQKHVRLFNADGSASGGAVAVTAGSGQDERTAIALDGQGNTMFAWTDSRSPTPG